MTTEQRVLEQIYKEGGKIPVHLIAKQLEMGNGYIEYLCEELFRKELVKKVGRGCYTIARRGRKKLEISLETPPEALPEIPQETKAVRKFKFKLKAKHKKQAKSPKPKKKVKIQGLLSEEESLIVASELPKEEKRGGVKKKTMREAAREIKEKIKERFKKSDPKKLKFLKNLFRIRGGRKV